MTFCIAKKFYTEVNELFSTKLLYVELNIKIYYIKNKLNLTSIYMRLSKYTTQIIQKYKRHFKIILLLQ